MFQVFTPADSMDTGNRIWLKQARSLKYFFRGQLLHFISFLVLLAVTWSFAVPVMTGKSWLGIKDVEWFWLATGIPALHQLIVWIVFRLQLGWAALSRAFGNADMLIWSIIFFPFMVARLAALTGLAISTRQTLVLPVAIALPLAIILLIPAVYTLWSVYRYFGFARAIGGDHFRTRYREMPLECRGAFRYSSNAMYAFGFFLLWSVALFAGSQAAMSAAIFQHAFVWSHYYCTEKPDMEIIFNGKV
jgi:hypothetical protein